MIGIKVKKEKAEKIRKKLIAEDALSKEFVPFSTGDCVLFPLKKEIKIKGAEIVDANFKKSIRKPRSLEEALENMGIYAKGILSSFDIIGDIAIVEIPEALEDKEKEIGKAIMDVHPNVKTVLKKAGPMAGEFRVREFGFVCGKRTTKTTYKENNVKMNMDVARVYFSPRLSYERMRVARKVKNGEKVLALFAGIGPFPLVIKKHKPKTKIVAVEINPEAVKYMRENMKLNKLDFEVIEGDVAEVLKEKRFQGWADRILMPLPRGGEHFLKNVFDAAKNGTIVHFYTFASLPFPLEDAEEKVKRYLPAESYKIIEKRIVRPFAPRIVQVVLDMKIIK
ncbi:MAG: class I SAM-dependent methyltransferase family protein [Candidatus Anstonellales archaeon]